MIPLLRTRLDRYALPLVLSGAAAAAIYNWRLWERDKALLARKGEAEPLLPLESWPERPMVSVLVAAWNEREHIERHIESFLALRYPHKELVLCAGGEDGTTEFAKMAPCQAFLLERGKFGTTQADIDPGDATARRIQGIGEAAERGAERAQEG